MINCHVHSIPVGYRWCFTFRRMTNCHVHSFNTHWFQKDRNEGAGKQKKKTKKRKKEGLRALRGPIWFARLWRKQRTTTTTGRSDSYAQWFKISVAQIRDLRRSRQRMLARSLYPLGTRASSWSGPHLSGSFVRSFVHTRSVHFWGPQVWFQVQIGCPLRRKFG